MIRFYRALLHLYPSSWRAEYGAEVCGVFHQRLSDASNPLAVIALWFEALADLLANALAVHFDLLRQDLRYAGRTFRRAPGFVLTSIVIAATGIGATTAAFTMVDHVVIRPLPFPHQERLIRLYENHMAQGARYVDMAPANYRDWKKMSSSFDAMGAYRALSVNLTGQGEPQTLDGAAVTAEMFPILGARPSMGRSFTAEDDLDASPRTVILGHGLWQSLYGGNPAVLGRTISLYDTPYTVIGVMPKGFYFPNRDAQLWTAMHWGPHDFENRLDQYIFGIGRLKPTVSLARAQADLNKVTADLARAFPLELARTGATLVPLRDDFSPQALLMLKVLLGAALCVLLIACTNLANLLMARSLIRRRELAVRSALGAGRERLVRQMLTESLMLSIAGGALGLLIAYISLPLLVRLVPAALPIAEIPPIDARVILCASLLTCLTGIGFGLMPALRACRGAAVSDLNEGGRSGAGARRERVRSTLVIAEIAGCIVLLVGFGLLARALWRIQATDPGFRSDHVLTLRTALPVPRYQQTSVREPFYRKVLDETLRLPGVTGAAYTSFLPMTNFGGIWPVSVEDRPEEPSLRRTASLRFVTPGYFSAMGIPLLAGVDVSERDSNDVPYVALVSESFVKRYWQGMNPIGRYIDAGNNRRRVIGVVGEVKFRGLERTSEPQIYLSWKQPNFVSPWYAPKDLVVRTTGDPLALVHTLSGIIHRADPSQPISNVRALDTLVDAQTSSRRVQLWVLGAFGAVAFLLAGIGIHGVLSFAVSSRTQEIGVRMAMGARPGDILGMMMFDGFRLAAAGIVAGAALAWGAGHLLQSLLAGVEPYDAATFTTATALALLMTMAGSLLPALRAVRIDPVTAIRGD